MSVLTLSKRTYEIIVQVYKTNSLKITFHLWWNMQILKFRHTLCSKSLVHINAKQTLGESKNHSTKHNVRWNHDFIIIFKTLHEFFHRTITTYKNTLNITIFRGPHENNIGAKLNWNYFTTFHTNNRLPIKTWFLLTLNDISIYIS